MFPRRLKLILPNSGLIKHALGFLFSTIFSLLATVLLLIGAVIWTVIVKKAQDINGWIVPLPSGIEVPLGIDVSLGNGLLLAWAAFACIAASLIPYMIRCVPTSRGRVVHTH